MIHAVLRYSSFYIERRVLVYQRSQVHEFGGVEGDVLKINRFILPSSL